MLLIVMWAWRAFIFSLSIALFAAISAPARPDETLAQLTQQTVYSTHFAAIEANAPSDNNNQQISIQLADTSVLPILTGKLADHEKRDNSSPSKAPVYQSRFNPNVSLPPFERQAASVFSSTVQNEPIFVLTHEFLAEILDLKHFLAPLSINRAVPWYLRPDAANSHGRLAGWKDGNTLYTGTITYLS